ncbi:hypothetical protein Rsub_08484 [Raphidocelis subcapitata]|uniref:Uncharacterized protein n=1 Tax=Raphidocelis subcapitata TaxID=307507 RepID=A0A2V0PDB2_9CHLO|nr:hypothetical protein Rsub_08484 [Raphidocelis subcapitata]|eukprot:GBF95893.1 hypothetical protein Rsub_08484 [Raphidocelis subcapitata]
MGPSSALSAALRRGVSTPVLTLPSSFSMDGTLAVSLSASADNIADLEDSLLFEDDAQPSSPGGAASPRIAEAPCASGAAIPFIPHLPAAAWDLPPPSPPAAAELRGGAALMARSVPRPIAATGRRPGGGAPGSGFGGDDGGRGDFVPPHLAASMVETQHVFGESLSTKGAAALRLRSSTLRRTGYLEGRISTVGTVRVPSS